MSFVRKQHIFPGTEQHFPGFLTPPEPIVLFVSLTVTLTVTLPVSLTLTHGMPTIDVFSVGNPLLRRQPKIEWFLTPTNWQILPGCFTSNEKKNPKEYSVKNCMKLVIWQFFGWSEVHSPAFPKKWLGPPVDNEEVHSITSSPVMAMVFNGASHVKKCLQLKDFPQSGSQKHQLYCK